MPYQGEIMVDQLLLAGLMQLSGGDLDCSRNALPTQSLTVVKVNDGDTLVLRDGQNQTWRVRMSGMDTPETFYFGKNQGPWAFAASKFLKERLPVSSTVQVEYDDRPCDGRGRVLAHVYQNAQDINQEILQHGLAVNYCVAPNYHHCAEYGALAQKAADEKTGLFSDPTVELPYIWRQESKSPPFEYWVGDMETKQVVSSTAMNTIPVGRRVIFYSKRWIQDPFHL